MDNWGTTQQNLVEEYISSNVLNMALKDQQYQILLDRLKKLQKLNGGYTTETPSGLPIEDKSRRSVYIKFPKTLLNAMKEVLELSNSNRAALQRVQRSLHEK